MGLSSTVVCDLTCKGGESEENGRQRKGAQKENERERERRRRSGREEASKKMEREERSEPGREHQKGTLKPPRDKTGRHRAKDGRAAPSSTNGLLGKKNSRWIMVEMVAGGKGERKKEKPSVGNGARLQDSSACGRGLSSLSRLATKKKGSSLYSKRGWSWADSAGRETQEFWI